MCQRIPCWINFQGFGNYEGYQNVQAISLLIVDTTVMRVDRKPFFLRFEQAIENFDPKKDRVPGS